MAYKRPDSVLVVVYTLAGDVLLLRRRHPADFWQSVTGSLRPGETTEQAARRELHEETGLEGADRLTDTGVVNRFAIRPEWRDRYAPGVRYNRERVFRYALDAPAAVRLNPEEHADYRWLPAARAAEQATSWTNRAAIRGLPLSMERDNAEP